MYHINVKDFFHDRGQSCFLEPDFGHEDTTNLTATAGSRKTPAPFLQNEDFSAVVYIPSTTCMLLMGGGHSGLLSFKKLLTTSPTLLRHSYKEILNEG
ncbi:hypothetical protein F2P79_005989 [Pimephales promelas]|nr:hypothetical protein F2P79_005989 [Pimephales promelas]